MQVRKSFAAAVAASFVSVVLVVVMPPEPVGVATAAPDLTALAASTIDPATAGDLHALAGDLDIRESFAALRTQLVP